MTERVCGTVRRYMLDTVRHLRTTAENKRMVDLLALLKLNTLHLHLVDDQGWRLEIKRYPKLTEVGARLANCSGKKGEGWFTPRLRASPFVLCPFADGIPLAAGTVSCCQAINGEEAR